MGPTSHTGATSGAVGQTTDCTGRVPVDPERHRASIARFYDCSHEFQVCLAQMCLSDPRFTQHYQDIEPGAAQWLRDAIVANAARHADGGE